MGRSRVNPPGGGAAAAAFYEHLQFRRFASRLRTLFLPIAAALQAIGLAARRSR